MGVDSATVGRAVGHDHPHRDSNVAADIPAASAGDLGGEASLSVHSPDELVDVRDVGLQLDHEKCLPAGVPGKDVDDSTLAVDRKRDLGFRDPVRQLDEALSDSLV
jgi:hypothetical protein